MKSQKRKQKGLAAVEFIITVPLLLIILSGIIEIGNALILYNTLSKMVQDGSRYAVTDIYGSAKSAQIADYQNNYAAVKNIVVYGYKDAEDREPLLSGMTTDNVDVNPSGKYVVVTARYPYVPVLKLIPQKAVEDLVLTSSSMMRTAL